MTPETTNETKRVPKLTVTQNIDNGTLVISFPAAGESDLVVPVNEWPADMQVKAKFHGAEQKLRDSVANKEIIGTAVRETVAALAESIAAGEWSKRGEPGERAEPLGVEIYMEMFAATNPATVETAM